MAQDFGMFGSVTLLQSLKSTFWGSTLLHSPSVRAGCPGEEALEARFARRVVRGVSDGGWGGGRSPVQRQGDRVGMTYIKVLILGNIKRFLARVVRKEQTIELGEIHRMQHPQR